MRKRLDHCQAALSEARTAWLKCGYKGSQPVPPSAPPIGPFHRMVLQSDSAFLIISLLSGPTSRP